MPWLDFLDVVFEPSGVCASLRSSCLHRCLSLHMIDCPCLLVLNFSCKRHVLDILNARHSHTIIEHGLYLVVMWLYHFNFCRFLLRLILSLQ